MSGFKPNWEEAPEWAKYWAADADGEAYWYDTRPSLEDTIWVDDGLHRSFAGYFGGSFDYRMVHRKPVAVNVEVTLTKPVEEVSIDYKLPENIFGYTAEEFASCPSKSDSSSADVCKLYPKYYKDVSGIDSLDVYGVHKLFSVDDPSGAIQHASKKLLLSGVRTGGKSKWDDIREARDTLNRWLELNKED